MRTGDCKGERAGKWRAIAVATIALALFAGPPIADAKNKPVPTPRVSPAKPATDAVDPAATDAIPDGGDNLDAMGEGDLAGDGGPPLPPAEIPEPGNAANEPFDTGAPQPGPQAVDEPLPLTPVGAAPDGDAAASPDPAGSSQGSASLTLEAHLIESGPAITKGMTWRVFSGERGSDGKMRLVGEAHGGRVTLKLKPGDYYVHASYGMAGVARKVVVGGGSEAGSIVLNAGGLRLTALVGEERALTADDVSFDIFAPDEGGSDERSLVVSRAPPASVIGLSAGIYHVICRYGDANAVVRADIKVEPGKLTEATVYQKAARLTLKLVGEHGGEALANTVWSVVTQSGDSVAESVGAFPSVVLAAGDYTAIAKHDGKIYERDFTVEAGLDRDVEVLAKE